MLAVYPGMSWIVISTIDDVLYGTIVKGKEEFVVLEGLGFLLLTHGIERYLAVEARYYDWRI